MIPSSASTRSPRDCVVLLVADDTDLRTVVRETLGDCGIRVVQTDREAVHGALEASTPDLVLLDVCAPGRADLELLERLRAELANAHLPIVLLVGRGDHESIRRAFAGGATDVVVKPAEPTLLELRVCNAIRSAEAARELHERDRRLAHAQRMAKIAYWESSGDDFRVAPSEFAAVFGITPERLQGEAQRYLACVSSEDRPQLESLRAEAMAEGKSYSFEYRLRLPDRRERIVIEHGAGAPGDGRPRLAGSLQDITQHHELHSRVHFLAYRDALTGLPNRRLFQDHVNQAIERADRSRTGLGCLLVDLDRFKNVNETFGHSAGDELLRAAAARLVASLRQADVLARVESRPRQPVVSRFGGDEFVVLLEGLTDDDGATTAADRIVEALRTPFKLQAGEVFISPSIGIARFPRDGRSAEELIAKADAAMYAAKAAGGAGYSVFADAMTEQSRRQLSIESQLRRALERDELRVYYQPRFAIQGADAPRMVGVEALVRWQHPQHGLILPGQFIQIAEETGLITPLGEWVVTTACREIARIRESLDQHFKLGINVSARQLADAAMPGRMNDLVRAAGLDVHRVELEITESVLMENHRRAAKRIDALRDLGFRLAIDDFGTGYSSFAYLKRFNVDYLKIDRSFIRKLAMNWHDAQIVSAIIAMAHGLRMKVIAEGVDEAGQLEFLATTGCDEVQGFLMGRPVPVDELGAQLRGEVTDPCVEHAAAVTARARGLDPASRSAGTVPPV